jgi:hypothetical protein
VHNLETVLNSLKPLSEALQAFFPFYQQETSK